MKKLMIFDLDGTLFNTNEVNFKAYEKALKEEGYSLDHEEFIHNYNGKSYKFFLPIITSSSNTDLLKRIHDNKKEYYNSFLDMAIVNNALFSIIEKCKKDYFMVIVTTASKRNCLEILDYFKKRELFDKIITAEDYHKTKPDPEGFLLAMESYNMSANNTIIFEDSDVGIEAAKKTNATIFKIENF